MECMFTGVLGVRIGCQAFPERGLLLVLAKRIIGLFVPSSLRIVRGLCNVANTLNT